MYSMTVRIRFCTCVTRPSKSHLPKLNQPGFEGQPWQ